MLMTFLLIFLAVILAQIAMPYISSMFGQGGG